MALFLEITRAGAAPQRLAIEPGRNRFRPEPGAKYRLVDDAGARIDDQSAVKRIGNDLVVDGLPGERLVEFDGFFVRCTPDRPCTLATDTLGGGAQGAVTPATEPVAALKDGSFLMTPTQAVAASLPTAPDSDFSMKWLALGAGVLGIAGAAGGGGGGGGGGGASDTTPPGTPTVTSAKAVNSKTPVIAGAAEAGSLVTVSIDVDGDGKFEASYTTTANATGAWQIDLASATPNTGVLPGGVLPEGSSPTIVVIAADTARNVSQSATYKLTIDTTAPATPTLAVIGGNDVVDAAEAGAAGGVPLSGTAEAGSTVQVTWGSSVKTATADANGTWTMTFTAGELPADGTRAVSVVALDAAGNSSAAATRTVTLDIHAPAAPAITSAAVTNLQKPVISGTAEGGAKVTVTLDTNNDATPEVTYQVTATTGGLWSINTATAVPLSGAIPGGQLANLSSTTVRAFAADAVGNAGAVTTATLGVDTSIPAAPTIAAIAGDDAISITEAAGTIAISGTLAQANRPVTVTWTDGTHQLQKAATVSGTAWTLSVSAAELAASGLADGASTVRASYVGANGANSAEGTHTVLIDRVAPGAPTITNNVAGTANGAVTYTFAFNEAVTGFDASDITVTGGTKGTFAAVDTSHYTLVVNPTAGTQAGSLGVSVAAAAAVDAGGNATTAATAPAKAYDTLAPTLAITDGTAATTTNAAVTYTFNFSEVVTGFDASDVTVTGGTKGAFTAVDGATYTLVVTPTAATQAGTLAVSVAAAAAIDAAGNGNGAAAAAGQGFDTAGPVATITDNVAGTAFGAVTYSFAFNEAITGFDATDITVTGGTKGAFTVVDTSHYTLVVTPAVAPTTGSIGLSIAAAAGTDALGNASAAATAAAQPYDAGAFTLGITDNVAGTANGNVTYTFTFNRDVADFDATDVTVTGGTKGAFTTVDAQHYTLVVAPTAATQAGQIDVSVAAGAAHDASTNASPLATAAAQLYDTKAPTVVITDDVPAAWTATGPVTFTFQFSEVVTGFDIGDVTLSAGTKGAFTAVDGDTYTLVANLPASGVGQLTATVAAGGTSNVIDALNNPFGVAVGGSQGYDKAGAVETITAAAILDDANATVTQGSNTPDRTPTIQLTLSALLESVGTTQSIETLQIFRTTGGVTTLVAGTPVENAGAKTYTLTDNLIAAGPGAYTYTAHIVDAAGNDTTLAGFNYAINVT